jgi:hypothetical protein
MMLRYRNGIALMVILLMNASVIGCDSCKKSKEGKDDLVAEEKRLVGAFSKELSLTSEQVKDFEKLLQKRKSNANEISLYTALDRWNKMKGLIPNNPEASIVGGVNILLDTFTGDNTITVKNKASAEKTVTLMIQILENIEKQIKLKKGKK